MKGGLGSLDLNPPDDRDQVRFICKVCGKLHEIENESSDYGDTCVECAIEKNTHECYDCSEWFYSPFNIHDVINSCCPKCNALKEAK